MKTLLLATAAIVGFSASSWAQTSGSITTMNATSSCCSTLCSPCYQSDPPYHLTGCDSNEKTPDEMGACKLDYWRKEVTSRQKTRDDAQKALDFANDRVRAFEQVGKR